MTADNPYLGAVRYAESTRRDYANDVRHFDKFCTENGETLPGASPELIAAYLASIARTHATTTVERRLHAIIADQRARGAVISSSHAILRSTLTNIKRAHGRPLRRAAALGTREVRAMAATCPPTLTGTRDRAAILLAYAAALRRSELVALDVEHLTFQPGSVRLLIQGSKTDQVHAGAEVTVPMANNRHTCPVRMTQAWLEMAAIKHGPIFRGVDRWGNVLDGRLHPDGIRRIVKRAGAEAGIVVADHEGLSPHGLRAGFITETYRQGALADDIMKHSRHKSYPVFRTYLRRSNKLSDNPARLLGL